MQVILTHEQSDFDAVASSLGAYLLHPGSLAIKPNRMNRNVRSFLEFYESELPFLPSSDLPKENISEVFLVDTQSLITLKGITNHTKVNIFDHHTKKENLPEDWSFTNTDTGACTTFFVEQLLENNGQLNVIQSTFLLLGIYEDTGSLTYTNTSPRDIRAAAFLLENNASLKLAFPYLNQPLSNEQRFVLDKLVKNISDIKHEGCNILISAVEAYDLEDEVSSIAHKLVDLYDPDGLFIFVKTRAGIRLVARSNTDQIDVSEIARQYQGGGHSRAASALIRADNNIKLNLSKIVASFEKGLIKYVHPAVKVQHIMSKKPLLINPDTSTKEAFELMRQYGYEGYPVVDGNQIEGLLVRRAVDRALSHGMDLPASSLMEAGNFYVEPEDSLAELQRVMGVSGWGQIPVVDPKDNQVIGIVTRTDLLKTLAGADYSGHVNRNLAEEISQFLPDERISLLKAISLQAEKENLPIYAVGGFARDILLNRPSLDLDFVVEGDAIHLGLCLSEIYGGQITSHKKFGTSKWILLDSVKDNIHKRFSTRKLDYKEFPDTVDLISARTEYYKKPIALPTIKKSSIKLDLQRRDFTINTLAVRLDGKHFGELYDYWGGYNDLKNKRIRVLHSLSFVDDPTRLLRAIRFEQRFGFSIEERTLDLVAEAKELLNDTSGDRIRHELDQIIAEPFVIKMLDRMAELDLLRHLHPDFIWNDEIARKLDRFLSSDFPENWQFPKTYSQEDLRIIGTYIFLFAYQEKDDLEKIIKRFRFKSQIKQILLSANELICKIDTLAGISRSQLARNLRKYPQFVIYCVLIMLDISDLKKSLEDFATKWRFVEQITNGQDLQKMGIEPGPIYREILDELRDAWLDKIISNSDEEKQLLSELIQLK